MAKLRLTEHLKQLNRKTAIRWLPPRKPHSHKGDYGKILLLCGSVGYTGAAVLSAQAAARSGAGLVYLGVPEAVYPMVASQLREPVVFPLPCRDGKLSQEAIGEILRRLSAADACLLGCGLGQSPHVFAVVKAVLEQAACPVVLDADGINVLRGHIDLLCGAACPLILTPHEGEFLRLGGDLSRSRLFGALQLRRQTGATVLLKGHRTLICGAEGCYVNPTGNAGMAKGGSGDVLSGMIVSLLGQGLSAQRSAVLGAWLHGAAGDLAAERYGQRGMLPSDLIELLPQLMK